jgi:hypothetical protein
MLCGDSFAKLLAGFGISCSCGATHGNPSTANRAVIAFGLANHLVAFAKGPNPSPLNLLILTHISQPILGAK